jgi:hypothetical protein
VERSCFVKRWRLCAGPLVLTLVAAVLCWWLFGGWTPARVERTLADLPRGSTPAEVEEYLRARSIPCDGLLFANNLQGHTNRRYAWVEIAGANVDPVFPGGITVHFAFDGDGRLTGYEIEADVWSL